VISCDSATYQVLTPQKKDVLRIFTAKAQCVTGHNGPLLTDQHFHNTAISQCNPAKPDLARCAAIAKVLKDQFNCLGRFNDAGKEPCSELRIIAQEDHSLDVAFKTPGLRNVSLRRAIHACRPEGEAGRRDRSLQECTCFVDRA